MVFFFREILKLEDGKSISEAKLSEKEKIVAKKI